MTEIRERMSGLYIHIPFCKSKCFYCSFASYEKKDELIGPYLEALAKEALLYKGIYKSISFDSVYIGGGTPTLLSTPQLKTLFKIIRSNFIFKKGCEVTIEANPATFNADKAKAIFDLGVNRASLGIQSLNDKYLKFLGRPHDRRQAVSSFQLLKKTGFKNINLDLIYSLPGQDSKEIKDDVLGLSSLGSQHVSLYTLSISEGSEFFRRKAGALPPEKQGEDYVFVRQMLLKDGFRHYEVSNFAKPGYACCHNMNYWKAGNYIGLGVSAHSHIDGHRYWNTASLDEYVGKMNNSDSAKAGEERLGSAERFMEAFLIGLRLTEGVDAKGLEKKFNYKLPEEKEELIGEFAQNGLLVKDNGRVRATIDGMVVLDEICSRLI